MRQNGPIQPAWHRHAPVTASHDAWLSQSQYSKQFGPYRPRAQPTIEATNSKSERI